MKIGCFLVMLLAGGTGGALADSTNLPVKIGATEAAQHYDQSLTVTGSVAQVTLRPSLVFINLDHPYPDSPFAAIIHSKDTNQFCDLKTLKGKSVELTGKIVNFHNRPEMVLEKPGQLLIITNSAALAPSGSTPVSTGTNALTTGVK